MLNILIGVLGTVGFFAMLATAYTIGRRHNKTAIAEQLTEQEQKEEELKLKGWENVLNFDIDVALGKRVNK